MSGPEALMAAAVIGGGMWLLSPIARAAAERLDFAERMLAKQRDVDRLAPPR
jgi:hypothetical protein